MHKITAFIKRNSKGFLLIFGFFILSTVLYIDLKKSSPKPAVASSYPSDGSDGVSIRTDFRIEFERPLTEAQKQNLSFRVVPNVPVIKAWQNNKNVEFLAQEPLEPSTTYKFSVMYNEEQIYTSSFTTRVLKSYSDEEIERMRAFAEETADAFYKVAEKYPFAPAMPLESDLYFIVYDYRLEQFRIRLQLTQNTSEEDKERYLNNALRDLKIYVPELTEEDYYVLYLDS